jgi:integrase
MARIIERVSTKGGKRYTTQIRTLGHSESKTFSTKTAAKQWAAKREVELREKPHLAGSEAHKHTLADAIDRYIRDELPGRSASQQRNQTQQLRWWRDRLGYLPLMHVHPPVLAESRDALKGEVSPSTVNRYLAALGIVLSTAAKAWFWIETNPMAAVSRLKEPKGRTRFLSDSDEDNELDRLLDSCRSSESPFLYPAVMLSLTTGGRQQEVLGLQWRDVDFEAGTVIFRRTKNGEVRTVGLSPEVADLLRPRRGLGAALVFPAPFDPKRPDRPPTPIDLRSAFETALKRAGIQDFHWHDLRHTAASYLAMEGASAVELAGVLGHKTLAMSHRYSHLSPEHVAQVSTKIADRIGRGRS